MEKAEELCTTRSQWILYHRVFISLGDATRSYSEKRDIPSTSSLAIVYRRSDTGAHEFVSCSYNSCIILNISDTI